jgi:site-specific recombinase XerD
MEEPSLWIPGDKWMAVEKRDPSSRWPVLTRCPEAVNWLEIQSNLGLAPRTIEAYARGLADYFAVCERVGVDPLTAERPEIAHYVRNLTLRPHHRGTNIVALDSGVGLANATLQQRLVAVRLFYRIGVYSWRRLASPRSTQTRRPSSRRGFALGC